MKKSYPTVDQKSETDTLASALVCGWLSAGWVVRPQKPDYHVDYIVEPVEHGELTGAKFCVQQKGHKKIRFLEGVAKESMKAKHLLYYAEKERLPVFLFAVDTGARRGRYIFIQEWLDQHVSVDDLRRKAKAGGKWSIEVPESNDIEDSAALSAEVRRSFTYMSKKYPGGVEDAIAYDIRTIAAVDPRWHFSLNVVDGKKHYVMKPKQDMDMSLQLTGAGAIAFAEFHAFGKPFVISGSDVSLTGSPLFENREIASVAIKPANSPKAELHIWTEGEGAFRLTLPIAINRGVEGLMLTGEFAEAPFRVEIKVPKAVLTKAANTASFKFIWAFEKWHGKRVTTLPYFDTMHALSMAILANRMIYHELLIEGNRITGGTFGKPDDEAPFLSAGLMADHAYKMRAISRKLGILMHLPTVDAMTVNALLDLELTHALIVHGEYKGNGSKFSSSNIVSFTENLDAPRELMLEELERMATEDGFNFKGPGPEMLIGGTKIMLGELSYNIFPAKISILEADRSNFLATKSDSIAVQILGTESSELHIKRVEFTPETPPAGPA